MAKANIVVTSHNLPNGQTSWKAILNGQQFWDGVGSWSKEQVGQIISSSFEKTYRWIGVWGEYSRTDGWIFRGQQPREEERENYDDLDAIIREIEEELA